jgi:hypothetical protein
MPLAIVLARKALPAPRPVTHEGFLLVMRPYMSCPNCQARLPPCYYERKDAPLRLKLLVNVLPHPGKGHTNDASCFLLL